MSTVSTVHLHRGHLPRGAGGVPGDGGHAICYFLLSVFKAVFKAGRAAPVVPAFFHRHSLPETADAPVQTEMTAIVSTPQGPPTPEPSVSPLDLNQTRKVRVSSRVPSSVFLFYFTNRGVPTIETFAVCARWPMWPVKKPTYGWAAATEGGGGQTADMSVVVSPAMLQVEVLLIT